MQNGGKAIRCPPFPCLESFQSIVHTPNLHTEDLHILFNHFLICLNLNMFENEKEYATIKLTNIFYTVLSLHHDKHSSFAATTTVLTSNNALDGTTVSCVKDTFDGKCNSARRFIR